MRPRRRLVIFGGGLPRLTRSPSTATNLGSDAVVPFLLGQSVSCVPAPTQASVPDSQRLADSETVPARDHRDALCHLVSEILLACEQKNSRSTASKANLCLSRFAAARFVRHLACPGSRRVNSTRPGTLQIRRIPICSKSLAACDFSPTIRAGSGQPASLSSHPAASGSPGRW